MSPKQRQAFDYIAAYIAERGFSPSLREIQRHFALASISGVSRMVDALIAQGRLVRTGRAWRNLALPGTSLRDVPTPELLAELARRGGVHG